MYVGLDVHKSSIEVAIAESGRRNEVRSYGRIDGTLAALDKVTRKLESKGSTLFFVYEAGPCPVTRFIDTSATKAMIVSL